ncbi:MAG: hypothetical protein AAGF99_08095 [Bacteroidota bacterium]
MAGCDSTEITPLGFDPFDTEGGVLSVYGVLEAGTSTQSLRVQLLRRRIERTMTPEAAVVGATVLTKNLDTGAQTLWVPRVVRLADSSYVEVYEAAFEPRAGTPYQLTVERSADQAQADVTVPSTPRGALVTPEAALSETVSWSPVSRVADTRLVVRIGCASGRPIEIRGALSVATAEGVARTTVDFASVRAQVNAALNVPSDSLLFVADAALTVTAADAAWSLPEDPSEQAQPGNTNVEGGYGRFGALTRGFFFWEPDRALLNQLTLEPCP